jgi:hypothetical protein
MMKHGDFRTRWLLLRGAPSWCPTNITQKHHFAAMDEPIVSPQKRCRTYLNYQWSYKDCGRILQVLVYNVVKKMSKTIPQVIVFIGGINIPK